MENGKAFELVILHGSDILASPEYRCLRRFVQHGGSSVYDHCFAVALLSVKAALALGFDVDLRALVRGSLLHDYFLYDWHEAGLGPAHVFRHGDTAAVNAKIYFGLTDKEENMVRGHMFLLCGSLPKSKEDWILTFANKISALRETFSGRTARPYIKSTSLIPVLRRW